MADPTAVFYYGLVEAKHGAGELVKPVGFSIREDCAVLESHAAGEPGAAAIAIDTYGCEIEVTWEKFRAFIAKNTKANITLKLKGQDGSQPTVTIADCKALNGNVVGEGGIYRQSQRFKYEGTSLEPVSIAL